MSNELSHEAVRELAKRIKDQLPDGVFYALLVWPPGEPDDFGYFSNAHRGESIVAIESLLGHGIDR
jgi:hypothetical protein